MSDLPSYDDLPTTSNGGRCSWGIFGPNDNVGLFNLLTPDMVVEAAKLIRKGSLFPLDESLDAFSPPVSALRGHPTHRLLHKPGGLDFDDVYDNFYPQGSSQWDALGHVGYGPDIFYNGATEDDVASGRRNTIEHWARKGIAGRAVLFDMVRALADAGRGYDPSATTIFSVDDLELARRRANVELRQGDVLILHTGFGSWYRQQSQEVLLARRGQQQTTPGIESSESMCRYLWDSHISAIASDNYAVESTPLDFSDPATTYMHPRLIGLLGMPLGELWRTDDFAADCADDGIYEAFFVSMPLNAPGGIGSPPNALAIK